MAGVTLRGIAEQLGMTITGVHKNLKRSLQELYEQNQSAAEQLRQLTNARYDNLILAIWPKAMDGDIAAVGEIRRIEETRHRILGTMLDPKFIFEQNITLGDSETVAQVARERLKALVANNDPKIIDAVFEDVAKKDSK